MAGQAASFRQLLILSASCAVIAGVVEATALAVRQQLLNRIVFVSFDFPWMAPLAFVAYVVPTAIGAHFLFRLLRRPLSLSASTFLLAAVLTFSILLPYEALAWWSSAILAAGVGFRAAMTVSKAPEGALRRIGRVGTVVVMLAALTGVSVRAVRAYRQRTIAVEPATPPTRRPNVLVIVLDTVRAANMGVYGYERPTTPALKQLAETSTVFERAIAPAPWTLPSHASLFTGRTPSRVGGTWLSPVPAESRFLAEAFRDRGYATGAFVANLLYTSYESGLTRGFERYDDYGVSPQQIRLHSSLSRIDIKSEVPQARSPRQFWDALVGSKIIPGGLAAADYFRPADRVAGAFLDWQQANANRPFFAFLNLFDAHGPYRAPDDFKSRFEDLSSRRLGRYDAAIAFLDQVIGNIHRTLQDRGVLDDTLVIITSDHGEQFGEHGLLDHANSLYLPVLHVPLILRLPGTVPEGRRIGTVVSLRDVAATVLDLAKLKDPAIEGSSLAAVWRDTAEPAVHGDVTAELSQGRNVSDTHRNKHGGLVSRIDGRYHYIRNPDGSEELFDYRADPGELNNLAALPAMQAELARLRMPVPAK